MHQFKSKAAFSFILFVAGLAFFVMFLGFVHIFLHWNPAMKLTNYCLNMMGPKSGLHFSIGTGFLPFIGLTLFILLWKIGKQAFHSIKMTRRMKTMEIIGLTQQISEMYHQRDIVVIHSDQPLAFTFGFLKPRIVLSTKLLNMLDKHEIEAVVLHENYHREHYDPLKMYLVSLLSSTLWFLPVLNRWLYDYRMMRELLADEAAIRTMGSQLELGSALLKLLKKGWVDQPITSVSFADQTVNVRLKKLVDCEADVSLAPKRNASLISIAILFLFMVTILSGCS